MPKKRKRFTASQKAAIVLEALKEEKGIAQIAHPFGFFAEHGEYLREGDQRLHAGVPGLSLQRIFQLIALQVLVIPLLVPARSLHDLMDALEREADEQTRRAIMESCGRNCIGASTLAAPTPRPPTRVLPPPAAESG